MHFWLPRRWSCVIHPSQKISKNNKFLTFLPSFLFLFFLFFLSLVSCVVKNIFYFSNGNFISVNFFSLPSRQFQLFQRFHAERGPIHDILSLLDSKSEELEIFTFPSCFPHFSASLANSTWSFDYFTHLIRITRSFYPSILRLFQRYLIFLFSTVSRFVTERLLCTTISLEMKRISRLERNDVWCSLFYAIRSITLWGLSSILETKKDF